MPYQVSHVDSHGGISGLMVKPHSPAIIDLKTERPISDGFNNAPPRQKFKVVFSIFN